MSIALLLRRMNNDSIEKPLRSCKICGRKARKALLNRYIWSVGKPQLDEGKRLDGRGAYCCMNKECIDHFWKKKKKWKIYFRL